MKKTNKGYRKPAPKFLNRLERDFAAIVNGLKDGMIIVATVHKDGIEVGAIPCRFNLKHTAQLINGLVEAEPTVMEAMLALKMAELSSMPEPKKKAPKKKK